jgi:hypothetical protein
MTRRTAAVVALVSVAGLLVSMLALVAWSDRQVDTADSVASAAPGPAAPSASRRGSSAVRAEPTPRRDARARPGRPVTTTSAALRQRASTRVPRPAQVAIPSVQLRAPVRPVGVAGDGQMRLPADPEVLGWYRFGPAPTAATGGSVVLAGHLDSTEFGIGPLVRLREVTLGSTVTVTTSRGVRHDYVVRRVQRFDRQRLPEEVFGRSGPELLRLVTCGGAYDPDRGYEQNLVVTAVPAP